MRQLSLTVHTSKHHSQCIKSKMCIEYADSSFSRAEYMSFAFGQKMCEQFFQIAGIIDGKCSIFGQRCLFLVRETN